MASRVTSSSMEIHQAFHGYDDGHRLLACTLPNLTPRDRKLMLVMSDASGSGAIIPASGYLTGYPLADSPLYAFARTWPATEMTRPGCVWSQTLLISFSDLAGLRNFSPLTLLFSRPSTSTDFRSSQPIREPLMSSDKPAQKLSDEMISTLYRLLWALYSRPRERVIATDRLSSERVVLSIWEQQWPRLRRSFRFCTLSFSDRSTENAPFDLQFVSAAERSIRARFTKNVNDADQTKLPDGDPLLELAIKDIFGNDPKSRFREFLRQVGAELAVGREAFFPLCRFYQLVEQSSNPILSIDEAIKEVEQSVEMKSSTLTKTIFALAISKLREVNNSSIRFVVDNIDLLGPADERRAEIGSALLDRDSDSFFQLLDRGRTGKEIVDACLSSMPLSAITELWKSRPAARNLLFDLRQSELLTSPEFWRTVDGDLLQRLAVPGEARDVIKAMVSADRSDLSAFAVSLFGTATVLSCLDNVLANQTVNVAGVLPWLRECMREPLSVATAVREDSVREREIFAYMARHSSPTWLPNIEHVDPWLPAVLNGRGFIRADDER
jgi:hypothetical protein